MKYINLKRSTNGAKTSNMSDIIQDYLAFTSKSGVVVYNKQFYCVIAEYYHDERIAYKIN